MTSTLNVSRAKAELSRRMSRVAVAMAQELKEAIKDNAKASKTITGGKMRKYSKPYENWRANHGFSRTPDLRRKGDMLDNASFFTTGKNTATLRPNKDDKRKAEGNQRLRKFYPENESDLRGQTLKRLKKAGEQALVA